jgi:hypothetical protein
MIEPLFSLDLFVDAEDIACSPAFVVGARKRHTKCIHGCGQNLLGRSTVPSPSPKE